MRKPKDLYQNGKKPKSDIDTTDSHLSYDNEAIDVSADGQNSKSEYVAVSNNGLRQRTSSKLSESYQKQHSNRDELPLSAKTDDANTANPDQNLHLKEEAIPSDSSSNGHSRQISVNDRKPEKKRKRLCHLWRFMTRRFFVGISIGLLIAYTTRNHIGQFVPSEIRSSLSDIQGKT
ncbi:hypothetical protein BKA69DRAFT_108940 [Paraphysoderma sedebokerense]|nr:hypothetical protein BKA69DRAFT_108940 [Paraphysoderma sedebokerense]